MEIIEQKDPELELLSDNKEDGYNYRERRHEEWTENYTLYRDRVIVNRLTQRQSVNLPVMKAALRTLMKDVDDMPVIHFENLDNDKQAEVFKNEYWRYIGNPENNKFEIQDVVDKKQVFHFGRTFDQWQIIDGMPRFTIVDPMDILLSRYMDPTNIHTSRYLIHTHIFVPLSTLELNPVYDRSAIRKLYEWYASDEGQKKAASNYRSLTDKNKKMADMGLNDVDSPLLGETFVELSLHFVHRRESGENEEQIYMYVEADDQVILMKKPLEKVIGSTVGNWWRKHYNYNSWADDVDKQDVWTDGVADTLRTPNKVLNTWFSQLVENRTLRSFGMHYYDASVANAKGFNPQTFNPVPWGWFGLPGKPADFLEKVDIPDLSEALDEMNFVIQMAEKASGATATQQGVQTERQITLGEVQLALGEAKERIKGMSKFYTHVWMERGIMFTKLVEAAHDKIDAVKIFKKGRNSDKIYSREIAPNDWMTLNGYQCRVWNQAERAEKSTQALERQSAIKANMPDNPIVDEEYKRKLLEFGEYSPEKIQEAMEYEQQKRQAMMQAMSQGMMLPGGIQPGVNGTPQPAMPMMNQPALPSGQAQ